MNTDALMGVARAWANAIDTVREAQAEDYLRECIDLALRHAFVDGWNEGVDEQQRVRASQWGELQE